MSGHSKNAVRLALAMVLIMAFAAYAESGTDKFYTSRTPLNIRCLDGNGNNLRLTDPPKIAHVTRCAKITFDPSNVRTVKINGQSFKFRKILKINGKDMSSIDAVKECNNVYALAYDDNTGRDYFSDSKPSDCGNNEGRVRPVDSGKNGGNGNKNAGSGMVQNPYGGCKNNNPEAGQKNMFCYRNVAFGWVEWGKYFTGCAPNSVVIIPVKVIEHEEPYHSEYYELYAVTNTKFKDLINGDMQEWVFSGATIAGNDEDVVNGKQLYVEVVERMKCERENLGIPCGKGYTVWKIKKGKDDERWYENDLKNKQIRFFSCGARVDGYTPNSNAYDYTKLKMCNMWWGKLEEGDRVNDVCKDARDKGRCICENHYRMACRSCYIASFGNSIETRCDGKSGDDLYQCLFDESAKVQTIDDSRLGFPRDYVDCNGKCKVSGGGKGDSGGNKDKCTKPFHPPIVKWFMLKQGDNGKAVLEIEADHDNAWGCSNGGDAKLLIEWVGNPNSETYTVSLGEKTSVQLNKEIDKYLSATARIELSNSEGKKIYSPRYSLGGRARNKQIFVPDIVHIINKRVEFNARVPEGTSYVRVYYFSNAFNEDTKKCDSNTKINCYDEYSNQNNLIDISHEFNDKNDKNDNNDNNNNIKILVRAMANGNVYEAGTRAIKNFDENGFGEKEFAHNNEFSTFLLGEKATFRVECDNKYKPFILFNFNDSDGSIRILRTVEAKNVEGGVVILKPDSGNNCKVKVKKENSNSNRIDKSVDGGVYYVPKPNTNGLNVYLGLNQDNVNWFCAREIDWESGGFSQLYKYDKNNLNKPYLLISSRWKYSNNKCETGSETGTYVSNIQIYKSGQNGNGGNAQDPCSADAQGKISVENGKCTDIFKAVEKARDYCEEKNCYDNPDLRPTIIIHDNNGRKTEYALSQPSGSSEVIKLDFPVILRGTGMGKVTLKFERNSDVPDINISSSHVKIASINLSDETPEAKDSYSEVIFTNLTQSSHLEDIVLSNIFVTGEHAYYGIALFHSSANITNTMISNTGTYGIYLSQSSANITNSKVSDIHYIGIYLSQSSANITNTRVSEIGHSGIFLYQSSANITNTRVSEIVTDGIDIVQSSANIINAKISNTGKFGIDITASSKAYLKSNEISNINNQNNNNAVGLHVEVGSKLVDARWHELSNINEDTLVEEPYSNIFHDNKKNCEIHHSNRVIDCIKPES